MGRHGTEPQRLLLHRRLRKATSLLNQTNRASLSGTYMLPWGFMVSRVRAVGIGVSVSTNHGCGQQRRWQHFQTALLLMAESCLAIMDRRQRSTILISLWPKPSSQRATSLSLRAESFNTFNQLNTYSRNGTSPATGPGQSRPSGCRLVDSLYCWATPRNAVLGSNYVLILPGYPWVTVPNSGPSPTVG